ncbi:MAG: tripartite tricarboxylate transporter substrate binding protein BugD [Betaproteobacteria bacterium]|nr:tripartite tricarboxylate transporter substrate binding protein BugD [Betaproteobacteria bacterium]
MPGKLFLSNALLLSVNLAFAQGYPAKPITLIVPFAAGGPSDAHMRQFGAALGRQLMQVIVIENVGGGAGNIGPARVARTTADGYTIMQHNLGFATAPALYKNLEFNPNADFDYLGTLVFDPSLMMARSDFPTSNFKDFIAYVKTNQAKISIGTSGPSHLSALLFMEATGTKLTTVPYKGGGPALNDLVARHIDLLSNSASIVGPLIKAGKVRAIGVTGKQRVSNLPEVPTLDEQGLTGFEMVVWTSIFAPRNLPGPVRDRLVVALQGTLVDAELVAHFNRTGGQIATREQATPAALQALVRSEVEKWGRILKNAGVQPE